MKQFATLSTLLFALALLTLASSCQKEPSANIRPEPTCKLTRAYYFDEAGAVADSLIYTYTNNKITKAANADGYITFDYNNDRITKRSFYEAGLQQPGSYDVATYNSDGALQTIKKYYNFPNQTIPAERFDFIYLDNKLAKLEVSYYDVVTSQYELYETTTYAYTGDNITQSITSDPSGSSSDEIFMYAYDSDKNHFTKSNAFFTDFLFMEEITGEIIPLFMSENNVASILNDGDEFPLSYETDENDNLYEWYFEGNLVSRYLHDCK